MSESLISEGLMSEGLTSGCPIVRRSFVQRSFVRRSFVQRSNFRKSNFRSSNVDEQTSKGLSPETRSLHSRLQFAYQFKMLRTESMKKAELNGSDESFCSVVFLLLLLLVCMRPPEAVKSWRRRPHFPLYLFPLSFHQSQRSCVL